MLVRGRFYIMEGNTNIMVDCSRVKVVGGCRGKTGDIVGRKWKLMKEFALEYCMPET